jgi:hypothetical protein
MSTGRRTGRSGALTVNDMIGKCGCAGCCCVRRTVHSWLALGRRIEGGKAVVYGARRSMGGLVDARSQRRTACSREHKVVLVGCPRVCWTRSPAVCLCQ